MKSYVEITETIASEYRQQRKIPVIGITGSVGKTTTKELIAYVLSGKYCVHKSRDSYNGNRTAVINTFGIKREHQVCVFELGINDLGQMERIVRCCRPTIPVLTGISGVHLEKLKTLENIYREKSHIFDTLPEGGKIIANGDDKVLMEFLHEDERIPNRNIFTYGLSDECMLRAENVVSYGLAGSKFTVSGKFSDEPFDVRLNLPGLHMVQNAVAAILLGILFDVSKEDIITRLKNTSGVEQRCQVIHKDNITIIADTYNSSPVSVRAALNLLQETNGCKKCILGDMNELGEKEAQFHRQIGEYAVSVADEAIFIGKLAEYMYQGAGRTGTDKKISWYPDAETFLEKSQNHIKQGDTVLIKASNKQAFSTLVEKLLKK